ncbi:CYFA0S01e06414g1_1 [Cyberlindnera fabianii]|uniref:CYFA0S01e06414g1_1 n=1 Tax=Cyberlindnera fabianii TaxID=36022 RepID=A0A061AQN5_CYBFA|nr:CYFA0S01e06414g1_1 [Cyberlindnera fabianii]
MSYPEESRPKKPAYIKTLPDRIAHSPTGISKIPNSRFPTLAPINPATYKTVYERAGFEVYKPSNGHKSAPGTPRSFSNGARSASTGHLPPSTKSLSNGITQTRNISEVFDRSGAKISPMMENKSHVPPLPDLKIDAALANSSTDLNFSNSGPSSAATAPQVTTNSLSGHNDSGTVPISANVPGYSFNRSEKLPPISSISTSGYNTTARRSIPLSSRSSSSPDRASSSHIPQSATSSKFDLNSTTSTNSSERSGQGSVYMSTQSFPNFGSNASLQAAPAVASAASTAGPTHQQRGAPPVTSSYQSSGTLIDTTTPTTSKFPWASSPTFQNYSPNATMVNNSPVEKQMANGISPSQKSSGITGAKVVNSSLASAPAPSKWIQPSTNTAADRSIDEEFNTSTSTTRHIPINTSTSTNNNNNDNSADSSDDELNLSSSEDEDNLSDDESLKSTILSPNPQGGYSRPVTPSHSIINKGTSTSTTSPPPVPPPHQSSIPSFTINDPDGNVTNQIGENPLSPTRVAKQLQNRESSAGFTSPASSHFESPQSAVLSPKKGNVEDDDDETDDEINYSSDDEDDVSLHGAKTDVDPKLQNGTKDIPEIVIQDENDESDTDDELNLDDATSDKDLKYDDNDDYEESNASAFEEVETQLDNLTMNSSRNHSFDFTNDKVHSPLASDKSVHPPDIKMHSVKQASTETRSLDQRSLKSPEALHSQQYSDVSTTATTPQATSDNGHMDSEISPSNMAMSNETFEPPITKQKHKYPPGEGPCRKCGLEITTKPIYSKSGELSGQWHRPCFTCTLCDVQFNKNISCFVLNDEPYCEYHYHLTNNSLCRVCGNGIVGKCLENDAQDRYHVDCLKCTKCLGHIVSDYLSIDGLVYCENCGLEYAQRGNTVHDGETPNIERRRTRLYFI